MGTKTAKPPLAADQPVVITRQWGDPNKAAVPLSEIDGWHITTQSGGTNSPLPRPALAAYVYCTAIPKGTPFSHSCRHGPPPHRIQVLVQRVDNKAIYDRLTRLVEAPGSRGTLT